MDNLKTLFHGFQEYIHEKSIMERDGVIEISYTPYSYDLIDADLDFDEAYYTNHLLVNFDKLLASEIMNLFKEHANIRIVRTKRGKMMFRNTTSLDKIVEYSRSWSDEQQLVEQTTTFKTIV